MEVDDMLIQRMRLWRLVPSLYGHPSCDALSYRFQCCRAVPGRKRNHVGLPLSRSSMSSSPRTHPPFRITQISLYNHGHQELVLPFGLFRMEVCRMLLQILFLGLLNILDPNASFAQM
uniref:Uncharacterized protein n=1 Tax=Zea mays TaxID=4577 RepID=A0A804MK99_MAIZE